MGEQEYKNGYCPVCGTHCAPQDEWGVHRYLPVTVGDDHERDVGWTTTWLQQVCEKCHCIFAVAVGQAA